MTKKNAFLYLVVLPAIFALAAGSAHGGELEPGFDALERVAGVLGTATTETATGQAPAATSPVPRPASLSTAPAPATEGPAAGATGRPGDFSALLDSPTFRAFRFRADPSRGEWTGACFGLNLLVTHWYQTFVMPVYEPGFVDRLLGGGGQVAGQMGVKGTVDRSNVEQVRLHAFSSTQARQEALKRTAVRFHDDQGYWFNRARHIDPAELYQSVEDDLRAVDGRLALLAILDLHGASGHSLLVYRVVESTGRGPDGEPVPTKKVYFLDPNVPAETPADREACHLVYWPREQRWSAASQWVERNGRDGVEYQAGARLGRFQLGYQNVNGAAARLARRVGNHWQSEVSRSTEMQ
jgi:hypothetical protein